MLGLALQVSTKPGLPAAVAVWRELIPRADSVNEPDAFPHKGREPAAHMDRPAKISATPASHAVKSSSTLSGQTKTSLIVAAHTKRLSAKPFIYRDYRQPVPFDSYLAAILNPEMNSAFVGLYAFPEGGPAKFGSDPQHWPGRAACKDSVEDQGLALDSHQVANSSEISPAGAANVCLLSSGPADNQASHAAQLANKAVLPPSSKPGICLLEHRSSVGVSNSSASLARLPAVVIKSAESSTVAAFAEVQAEALASAPVVSNSMCWIESRQHGNVTSTDTGKDAACHTV